MSDTEQLTPIAKKTSPIVLIAAIAGAALVAVALAIFVIVPLLSGDDDERDVAAAAGSPGEDPSAEVAPEDVPTAVTADDAADVDLASLPTVTYEVFLDRDPFLPVRPEPEPTADEPGTGGADAGNGGTTNGGSAGSDAPPRPGPVSGGLTLLEFVDATDGTAQVRVRVGEIDYVVGVGSSFAEGYRIDAIDEPCIEATTPSGATRLCLPDPVSGSGGCVDGGTVVCDGRTITLVGLVTTGPEPVAVVQVDSTVYEVTQGEVFAGQFRVTGIAPPCATFGYGDVAFTLCVGDTVTK